MINTDQAINRFLLCFTGAYFTALTVLVLLGL